MSYTEFDFPNTHFYDTDLRELIHKITKILKTVDSLAEWRIKHEEEYAQLKELYDQIISGDFPPSVITAFEDWMRKNALDLVGKLVKMVFFGLNDDGYFVVYIPESWEEIAFKTTGWDIDISNVDYGHLVLLY